jgi:hypothetical protein
LARIGMVRCRFPVFGSTVSVAGSQVISSSALTSASVGSRYSTVRFSTPSQLHCGSHLVGKIR